MLKCIERDDCIKVKRESVCETKGSCFIALRRSTKFTCQVAGCFDDQLMWMYCRNNTNGEINKYNQTTIVCCSRTDFCNRPMSHWYQDLDDYAYVFYGLLAALLVAIVGRIYFKRCKSIKKFNEQRQFDELAIDYSVYKQITKMEKIDEGRYGQVFKAIYKDQGRVVVKKFADENYHSYEREVNIYKIASLSRDSILKCVGWDTVRNDISTEYWLVLNYCELGSLYDYLQNNVLERNQLLSILLSAITGLNHLHDIQEFTISKPGIAHRDLKSKNLLMKSDRTVCIADFGLSVTRDEILLNKESIKLQCGTIRYFAPEVLNQTLDPRLFESFTKADIYSLALVFWESINRSEFNPTGINYLQPYYEHTKNKPSIDEMKKIVVTNNKRPNLLFDESTNDSILVSLCEIIRICWDPKPTGRLSSFEIKKNLDDLHLKNKRSTIL